MADLVGAMIGSSEAIVGRAMLDCHCLIGIVRILITYYMTAVVTSGTEDYDVNMKGLITALLILWSPSSPFLSPADV